MARLIDADDLIKNECGNCDGTCEEFDAQKCLKCTCHCHCALRGAIDDAPTIEADPVRHGEWSHDFRYRGMKFANAMLRCSECGNGSYILEGEMPKFCQHCGAKMDKKSHENHKKYQEEETNKKAFK